MVDNSFPSPDSEKKQEKQVVTAGSDLPKNEKDLWANMIEEFIFTPRARSKHHAQQFLRDWIQRYSR